MSIAALVLAGVELAMSTKDAPAQGNSNSGPALPSQAPSLANSAAATQDFGDKTCSIDGSQVNTGGGDLYLKCDAPLPRSMAGMSFKIGSVLTALYINTDLPPKPDTFVGYEEGPNCNWWGEWPTAVPDLYLVNPSIHLSVESGRDELATVTDVHVQIFKRSPLSPADLAKTDALLINCQIGGGSNMGNVITVDTAHSKASLASDPDGDFNLGPARPMPPATLSSKNVEYDSAAIEIDSLDGHLYQGTIRIIARVNGEEKVLEIGSRSRPFQWVSDHAGRYDPENATIKWDPEESEWTS